MENCLFTQRPLLCETCGSCGKGLLLRASLASHSTRRSYRLATMDEEDLDALTADFWLRSSIRQSCARCRGPRRPASPPASVAAPPTAPVPPRRAPPPRDLCPAPVCGADDVDARRRGDRWILFLARSAARASPPPSAFLHPPARPAGVPPATAECGHGEHGQTRGEAAR